MFRSSCKSEQVKLLKIRNDCVSEFVRRILAAKIFGANLSCFQHTIDGIINGIAVRVQIYVSQQFGAAQQHRRWIGHIFANSFRECVSRALKSNPRHESNSCFKYILRIAHRFEHTSFGRIRCTGDDTSTTNQATGNIIDDTTVQIRRDHNVKLKYETQLENNWSFRESIGGHSLDGDSIPAASWYCQQSSSRIRYVDTISRPKN